MIIEIQNKTLSYSLGQPHTPDVAKVSLKCLIILLLSPKCWIICIFRQSWQPDHQLYEKPKFTGFYMICLFPTSLATDIHQEKNHALGQYEGTHF